MSDLTPRQCRELDPTAMMVGVSAVVVTLATCLTIAAPIAFDGIAATLAGESLPEQQGTTLMLACTAALMILCPLAAVKAKDASMKTADVVTLIVCATPLITLAGMSTTEDGTRTMFALATTTSTLTVLVALYLAGKAIAQDWNEDGDPS